MKRRIAYPLLAFSLALAVLWSGGKDVASVSGQEPATKAAEQAADPKAPPKAGELKAPAEEAKKVEEAKKAEEPAKKVEETKKAEEPAKKVEDTKTTEEPAKKVEETKKTEEPAKAPEKSTEKADAAAPVEPGKAAKTPTEAKAEKDKKAELKKAGSNNWMLDVLVVAGVIVLPIGIGYYGGRALRMEDLSWKIWLVSFTTLFAVTICVMGTIKLGIDLKGGAILVYEVDHSQLGNNDIRMDELLMAITKRVNPGGLKEVVVRPLGADQIEIILPEADEEEAARIEKLISNTGSLEFRILANNRDHQNEMRLADKDGPKNVMEELDGKKREVARWVPIAKFEENNLLKREGLRFQPRGGGLGLETSDFANLTRVTPAGVNEILVVIDEQNIEGKHLARVGEANDDRGGPAVSFSFKTDGSYLFGQLTGDNLPETGRGNPYKRQLGIILSGDLYTAPDINSRITETGIIEGEFTRNEVRDYVSILQAGSLPTDLQRVPISKAITGATLGEDTVAEGKRAIVISLFAVLIFMLFYYRFAGVVADIVLIMNLIFTLALMILFSAVFTLPGIAGMVLTVGMAVDANVLIYERMREELSRGATLRMAIRNGFDRATTTIVDANLTTLITALVLYWIGTDQVKGFAVTLFIGIALSMYTAIFVARLAFDIVDRKRWVTSLNMVKLLNAPKFDYLSNAKTFIGISVVTILLGLACVFSLGKNLLDIDFTGGSSLQVVFDSQLPASELPKLEDVRKAADKVLPDVVVKNLQLGDERPGIRYAIDTSLEDENEAQKLLTKAFEGKLEHNQVAVTSKPSPEAAAADKVAPRIFDLKFKKVISHSALQDKLVAECKKLNVPENLAVTAPGYDEGSSKAFGEWKLTLNATESQATAVTTDFAKTLEDTPYFPSPRKVGSQLAASTCYLALVAIGISLVCIIIYLWFRFHRPMFGVAAVVAVVHDVLITLGALAASHYLYKGLGWALVEPFKINLTIVAAFLTIIGYSLNDTIVIFDRIREIRGKSTEMTPKMINDSINQTLSRTILTTFTTLLVVIILYVGGGEGLRAFSFALLIGLLAGTYSTVFIASPVLLWLYDYGKANAERERGQGNQPNRAKAAAT